MHRYEKELSAIICPYDKNHVIHKSRIQRHLTKCSRNFPPNYLETCPFNATHLMATAELATHIEQCPDRKYIDSERYHVELKNHGSLKLCPPSKAEACADIYSDVWEDDKCIDDFKSDASIISNSSMILPRTDKLNRRPYGYSGVMMLEVNELSQAEDVESVTSSMGRGKILSGRSRIKQNLHVGRGRGYFFNEMMEVGASATTDVEDLESVTGSIGRGGTNYY